MKKKMLVRVVSFESQDDYLEDYDARWLMDGITKWEECTEDEYKDLKAWVRRRSTRDLHYRILCLREEPIYLALEEIKEEAKKETKRREDQEKKKIEAQKKRKATAAKKKKEKEQALLKKLKDKYEEWWCPGGYKNCDCKGDKHPYPM